MRMSLPLSDEQLTLITDFTTTPFRTGVDEDAWLAVNNAAFSTHPEQGGWTRDVIAARQAENWYNPEGFLMHWDKSSLAAFCWTKVHRDTDPQMGEIYVIAVDPAHASKGLGRRMTIAGLAYLAKQNVPLAMLYVDADNAAAMSVYTSLGFTPHHRELAFIGDVAAK
jgi:mycothiol synthase